MNIIKLKQMKRFFLFVLTLSLFGVSCSQKSGIIGTFTGLTNDTLRIEVGVLNDEYEIKKIRTDTVVVRGGKFFYDTQTNNLTELTIIPFESIEWLPGDGGVFTFGPGANIVLLYYPNDHIQINAHYEDDVVAFHAKGNHYNEQLSKLNANTQNAYKQRNDALKVIRNSSFDGDKTIYREQLREAVEVMRFNNLFNYVCENPDDPFSAYLVASFFYQDFDKILQYTDSLGVTAMSSEMGRILWKKTEDFYRIRNNSEEDKKKEIAKKEMIGKPAPEFTLKDINGNEFSLSSLREKYVVLDFWGTWCGWCFVAFPDIKKHYITNPDEFEIVGIAFSDKPEEWRKAVLEKPILPWINVFDDDDLHNKFYVIAAPTYVLIDKEGIIVDFPQSHHEVIKQLNELREKNLL